MASLKILGNLNFSEFMQDVKIEDLLGQPYTFTYITSITSLTLELDPLGLEKVTILCCMGTVLNELVATETGGKKSGAFERIRVIIDGYFTKPHELYYNPPLGRAPEKVSKHYQEMLQEFTVSLCYV